MERIEKRGYLVKEGGSAVKNWRKRWFVLVGHSIIYSKTQEDLSPLGTIHLEDIVLVEKTNERPSQKHVFVLRGEDQARSWFLSAASDADANDWIATIKKAMKGGEIGARFNALAVHYVTVECFANKGVRVNGHVPPVILASLGQGVPSEKKRRDERGWFCEKHIPVCTILNLFTAYGWTLASTYELSTLLGDTQQSANVAVFSRRNSAPSPPKSSAPTTPPSATTSDVAQSPPPVGPKPKLPPQVTVGDKTRSLLGDDKEMAQLMQAMGLNDLLAPQ